MWQLRLNLKPRIVTYIFFICLRIWKLPWAWWSVPSSHGDFKNFRNGFGLKSRNPKMGFPVFKILQGPLLMYKSTAAACAGTACCLCRSAAVCQRRGSKTYLTGLVEMGLFPAGRDKPENSTIKMFSWKNPKEKHPLVTPHQKHSDHIQSTAISWVCWSINLLKDIYEIQSLKNALQSERMWL